MTIKALILPAMAMCALAASASAQADTIDWNQSFPPGNFPGVDPAGFTSGGVGFSFVSSDIYTQIKADPVNPWDFPAFTPILYDFQAACTSGCLPTGTNEIDFQSQFLASLTGIAIEPAFSRAQIGNSYTVTIQAFAQGGAFRLYSATKSGTFGSGVVPTFNISPSTLTLTVCHTIFPLCGIQSVTLSVSDAASGFAIGTVPEPAAWALMLVGVGGVGAAIRGRHRRTPAAA
jgi:hypothetical protein